MRALSIALCLGITAVAAAVPPCQPFAQTESDLKPDQQTRFGVLPNGLRYAVRPNREPKGRASLRLVVLSGSLEEKPDQQGLAHFLEHMAFNGSAHYAPGTLVEYFQRLGMSFGGDTNAYTSFDHTAYEIELPDTRPSTVADGLRVLSDFAGSLLLRPDMIVKERPIILSEKRTRDSVDYREFVASFDFLLGETRFDKRFPIGLTPDIDGARRGQFVDLYNTWYRPERMAVVVVGDVDPVSVERRIESSFGPVADRAPARPVPGYGRVVPAVGLKTAYHAEPEAAATDVTIDVMSPYPFEPDTAARRLRRLPRDLAVAMFNRRLEILSKKPGAPFIQGSMSIQESFNFVRDAGIDLTCPPERWRDALSLGERELRRAVEFGFTEAELHEAAANLRNGLHQAVAAAATRRSPELADEIVESVVNRDVFTSPAEDLALLGPALDRVTPGDCAAALRSAFAPAGRYVMVSGNARIAGNPGAAVAAAYQAARATPVEPPVEASAGTFAYTDFGRPGAVAERREVADLGLTLVRFANGVRVNLKTTPYEADRIRISVRIGAGELVEPRDKPGLALFSDLTFGPGGLGRHSEDDLERILAGRTVGFTFRAGSDALEFEAATNRRDLLLELQLLAAHLTDPGYRPEALRLAQKSIVEYYDGLAHDVGGPLQAVVPRLLADGDPRFGLPERAVVLSRTLDEERAWLAPQLEHGPVEIGIVGDLDPDATLKALARTFGALPARDSKPPYLAERAVRFPSRPFARTFRVPTEIPKAVVAAYWPTADARDVHRTRRLDLLSQVLNDRLRVKLREKMGAAYDPEAFSDASDTYTDYGMMAAEVVVAPARVRQVEQALIDVAADLAAHGVTEDEMKRAQSPILTAIRQSERTNNYWLGAVLAECQEYPRRLDWARSRQADFASITAPELDALAKAYLAPSRAFQVISTPAGASDGPAK